MGAQEQMITLLMTHVFGTLSIWILPTMLGGFALAIFFRLALYWVVRSKLRFAKEYSKRLHFYLASVSEGKLPRVESFSRLNRALMEKTYLECFEIRQRYKKRSLDKVESIADRLFLLHEATRRLVEDMVLSMGYFTRRPGDNERPNFQESVRTTFDANPYYSKLLGIFPVEMVNDLLASLPGLFLIAGIFGTFVGIAQGLPELGGMNLGDIEQTKKTMDGFLSHISAAMVKSIVGIGLSAIMGVLNTITSIEGVFYSAVTRLTDALVTVWHETTTNERIEVEVVTIDKSANGKAVPASPVPPPPPANKVA